MDLDEAVVRGERFALNLETVAAEGKIADDELTGIVGGERTVELEGVTGEIDGGFEGEGVRAGDFEVECSGVALGVGRKSEKRKSEKENAEVE